MMKKIIIILICTMGFGLSVFSGNNPEQEPEGTMQNEKKPEKIKEPLTNRFHIGGNIGFGFANRYFFANIQPRVSYKATKWLYPGITLDYQYSRRSSGGYISTYNTYGAGVFVDVYPIQYIYGRIEYQHLWHNERTNISAIDNYKSEDNYLLIGAGLRIPVAARVYVTASILFNVLNNNINNIYQNPVYSIGVGTSL